MMGVTALSLPSIVMLKRVVKPRLLAIFVEWSPQASLLSATRSIHLGISWSKWEFISFCSFSGSWVANTYVALRTADHL